MREALVFGVVAPAGARSELSRTIPRSPGGESAFSILPDLLSHVRPRRGVLCQTPDGIICDIGRSLGLLKTVLAEFDYRNLDEFAEFRGRNTTREFLACEVHKRLVQRIEEVRSGLRPAPVSE